MAFGPVRNDLEKVEEVLLDTFQSSPSTFRAALTHSVASGGKRIRPALVLLSAQAAGGHVSQDTINLAAAFEAIHLASLIHDDVVDRSQIRRGAKSVNSGWGTEVSVVLADFIFSTALAQMCTFATAEVLQAVVAAMIQMAQAELQQIENRNNLAYSEADYLRVVQGKAGALISACCTAGAVTAGAQRQVSALLTRFGERMGAAFQLADDVLDLVGDPSKTGKPVGKDILEGKMTLPLISSLSRWDGQGRSLLTEVLGSGQAEPSHLQTIVELVVKAGGVDYARRRARELADEAKQCLSSFPPSLPVEALMAFADFAVEREG
jgi:geranylgeranyl pyrophosphate synthase